MIPRAVARRYARALLGLLEPSAVDATRAALRECAAALTSSESLRRALESPAVRADQKLDIVMALAQRLGAAEPFARFLAQLASNNRLALLPEIANEFGVLADKRAGVEHVTITSARPVDSGQRQQLDQRLRTVLGRQVDLSVREDPRLLAGLTIQIGSTVYDSSLRARLGALKAVLTKE